MKAAIIHEWRILCHKTSYRLILFVMGVFALFAASLYVTEYNSFGILDQYSRLENGMFASNPSLAGVTVYNSWLGGRLGYDICATIFYLMLPVVSVLPFSASFLAESKTGYSRSVVTRVSKYKYCLAKYLITFFSGFSVIFLPLLVNFLSVACFIPAYVPDPSYPAFGLYGVNYGGAFTDLFYKYPLVYSFVYMLIPAVFAGLWATVPMTLSLFVRNKYIVLFFPYIGVLFYTNVFELLFVYRIYIEASPLYFLRGAIVRNTNNVWFILGWFCFLFVLTFIPFMLVGGKKDVY